MAADSEEVINEPPLLKTRREKLRFLQTPAISGCTIVAGGAGEYNYIGMICDRIEEKLQNCGTMAPDEKEIGKSIRGAVAEVWRDHVRYDQRAVDAKILIATRTTASTSFRLTVVSGPAVRRGSDVEAIGIGDALFMSLADRFVHHGNLSTVLMSLSVARAFMVYAMYQAKASIPGIGGNTRIISMAD